MPSPTLSVSPDFFSPDIRVSRRFYLDLGRRGRETPSVVAGGWEECAPNYLISRTDFPHLSIELVADGRGSLVLDGRRHILAAGTVFTYGPGIPHRITSDPAAPLQKYFVDFHGRGAAGLLAEAGLSPGFCGEISRTAGVSAVWEELIRFGSRLNPTGARGASRAFELLVLMLADDRAGGGRSGRAEATLDRCEAYMQQHFLEVRTVEEVAVACHVDVAYLCRLFRRRLAQTPYHYLQRLRMGWAAGRLRQPGRLVREVADELKLDPFQFSRTFKRVHGVSPSGFQRDYGR